MIVMDGSYNDMGINLEEAEELRKSCCKLGIDPRPNKTKPNYYSAGEFDVIHFCQHHKLDFCTGNVIKYLVRAGKKGDALEDLQKAKEYLERMILNCTKDLDNEPECDKFDPMEELNKLKI